MKITYLGHSCLYIDTGSFKLLADPFITGNEKASGKVDIAQLQPDYILLTHAHQDHTLDVDVIARRTAAIIISNFEIASHYEDKGHKAHPMNHGGSREFPFGTLKYVQAIHSSSFADGSYGGQPGGFVLTVSGLSVYIAGDTALTMDMKLIPLQYQLSLAVLPLGDNFTMGIEDAVLAADFVSCDRVLGYHYDTFGYIEIDHDQAREAFSKAGKKLYLPGIGESVEV